MSVLYRSQKIFLLGKVLDLAIRIFCLKHLYLFICRTASDPIPTFISALQMNQQHFPGGGMVPPFLPPGSVPAHARALIGYPLQPGVVVPPGIATSAAGTSTKEEKHEDDRVSA